MSEASPLVVAFAVPGDIDRPTGGYAYARALLRELGDQATTVGPGPSHVRLQLVALSGLSPLQRAGLVVPTTDDSFIAKARTADQERLASAAARGLLLVDGLAYGALDPAFVATLSPRPVVLLHHPLGHETGLAPQLAQALTDREASVLRHAAHIIVTSPTTARTLVSDFSVAADDITVALPGLLRPSRPRLPNGGRPVAPGDQHISILTVGTLTERKAHRDAISALATLTDLEWHWSIIGDMTADPNITSAVISDLNSKGIADRTTLHGAVDDDALLSAYDSADIFLLSSRYEGYGMAFAEALAAGLPVVATTGGATAETVPADAGALVEPGDTTALAMALRELITNETARLAAGKAAQRAGEALPGWDHTARIVADTLRQVTARKDAR